MCGPLSVTQPNERASKIEIERERERDKCRFPRAGAYCRDDQARISRRRPMFAGPCQVGSGVESGRQSGAAEKSQAFVWLRGKGRDGTCGRPWWGWGGVRRGAAKEASDPDWFVNPLRLTLGARRSTYTDTVPRRVRLREGVPSDAEGTANELVAPLLDAVRMRRPDPSGASTIPNASAD
jgi:hypothetical protein